MLFDRALLAAALPQYEVGEQLGRGGFGVVVQGRHKRLDRPVAIKLLTMPDPDMERRFLAEAQVMARLDHPHMVQVHDYTESNGLCVIVMELLPGGTLSARIPDLRVEQSCAIGLAIADALQAAHQRGIVHRDIKPDNVLFAADGAVKVTDFGLAKLFEGTTATTGRILGTPAYVAPEQILGQPVGPATDVYSLGVMLYHLLTGRPPFGEGAKVDALLRRQLTKPPALPAGIPPRIAAVLGHALEKDPAARPASALDFGRALAAAAAQDLERDWLLRAEMPARVDDEIRAAAAGRATAAATQTRTRQPAGRHSAADSDQARPWMAAQPPHRPADDEKSNWTANRARLIAVLIALGLIAAASITLGIVLGIAHRATQTSTIGAGTTVGSP